MVILLSASTLRAFLLRTKRQEQTNSLDKEVGSIFVARDGTKIKLLSQSSAQIFMVAIMEYLALHPSSPFLKAIILSTNARLERLMVDEHYVEAYDIAHCAFEFAVENE